MFNSECLVAWSFTLPNNTNVASFVDWNTIAYVVDRTPRYCDVTSVAFWLSWLLDLHSPPSKNDNTWLKRMTATMCLPARTTSRSTHLLTGIPLCWIPCDCDVTYVSSECLVAWWRSTSPCPHNDNTWLKRREHFADNNNNDNINNNNNM